MSLDFDRIVLAHTAWKTKLRAYLRAADGSLSAVETADADICRLGRWMAGDGAIYGAAREFRTLKAVHESFHRAAADVIFQADQGKSDERALLGPASDYDSAARGMVDALKAMRIIVEA